MRIAITAGHNVYTGKYFDPGAVNPPLTEADIVKETVALLIPLLERQGHIVLDCTPYGETFIDNRSSHVERCKRVDKFNADIYIDLHLNAGGGTGVEVWVHNMNSKSVPFALKIAENISNDMNLINRGIKAKPTFWSVSLTTRPAMIIEGAFIDNNSDMTKLTPLKYATAVARAFGEVKIDKPIVNTSKLYRVQVGAYSVKENADQLLQDLKKAGFNGFIKVEDIEVLEDKKAPKEETTISKYYEMEGLKVIETEPENIYVAALPGKTLKEFGIYGINGTWQDNANTKDTKSIWGIAANDNKILGPNSFTNSPQGFKRGTIIFHKDGTIEVKRINGVNEITKPYHWAIGGGMLLPSYNPNLEGFTGAFVDVLRKTAHTGMGYRNGKVYLFVKDNCTMPEFLNSIRLLQLQGAIFLDGGGSTQLNYVGDKGIHSSRKLSHGVFIKKI